MGRRPRIDHPGAWHHVMNRGARRQDAFLTDADRGTFQWLLARIHDDFGMQTHAFCLMSNHYHLLLRSSDGHLSAAMQRLGAEYTRLFNRRHGFDGPLFRSRFYSKLVETDAYLLTASRYIHRNPLEAGLTDQPAAYRWSSHRWYAGRGSAPSWLRTGFVLGLVGGDRDRYRGYVEHGADTGHQQNRLERPDRDLWLAIELEAVDQAVASVTGASMNTIRRPVPGQRSGARALAICVAAHHAHGSAAEIARHYGVSRVGTLRQMRNRAQRLIAENTDLQQAYRAAIQLLRRQHV